MSSVIEQALCSSRKRLRTEDSHVAMIDDQVSNHTAVNGSNNNCNYFRKTCGNCIARRFLPIPANHHVFHSEDWKPKGETLYIPTDMDALVNLQNIEQITVRKGSFFLGDENSRFNRSAEGIALDLWRYNDQIRRLYISRSFVFTSPQVFDEVKQLLDLM